MDSGSGSSKRKSSKDDGVTQLQLPLLSDALKESETLRAELNHLRQENASLKAEIIQLKSASSIVQVAENTARYSVSESISATKSISVSKPISASEPISPSLPVKGDSRVKLFLSLFRARDDVYAERWQKNDGTTNYSPAKSHDWNSHTRNERGKLQCGPKCQLLPLTEKVVQEHLNGQRTVGIYPLLRDETCWLLAVDFDDAEWNEDALAFK